MSSGKRVAATMYGGGVWTLFNSGAGFRSVIGHAQQMARVNIENSRRIGFHVVHIGSVYKTFHAVAPSVTMKSRDAAAPDIAEPLIMGADGLGDLNIHDLVRDKLVQTAWEATGIVAPSP